MKINPTFFLIFSFTFLFISNTVSAQNVNEISNLISSCPYTFTKNLEFGVTDKDVFVLQQILNSDRRTTIAVSGPGSPGQESNYFGPATRSALKKFQALFIEFFNGTPIEKAADGKFNDITRKIAQAVCDGDYLNSTNSFSPESQNQNTRNESVTNDQAKTQNEISENSENGPEPKITLSANANEISPDSDLKVFIDTAVEVEDFGASVFIIDGGEVTDIRKLGKGKYFALVTPSEDAEEIVLQIEAEQIFSLNKKSNSEASNEVTFTLGKNKTLATKTKKETEEESSGGTLQSVLGGLLEKITGTKDCNGIQIPTTSTCNPSINSQPLANQVNSSYPTQTNANTGSTGSAGGSAGGAGGGLQSILGSLFGFGKGGNASQRGFLSGLAKSFGGGGAPAGGGGAPRPGGSPASGDTSGPLTPSALEKAKAEADKICNDISSGSDACLEARQNQIMEQLKVDKIMKSCGGLLSDSDARQQLKSVGICIKQNSDKYEKLPGKVVLLLKKLKEDCKCDVVLTGGTIGNHATHKPGQAIFDLRSNSSTSGGCPSGVKLTQYLKSKGRNIDGARFVYEGEGSNSRTTAEHWHVIANGYQGQCGGDGAGSENQELKDKNLE